MKQWNKIFKKKGRSYTSPQNNMPKIVKIFKDYNVKKILDLGCGAGGNLVYLAKRGFEVYGIDIAKEGIKVAKDWLKENNLHANLKVGNVYKKLSYKDNFFDAVISVRVLHHARIEDIRRAIKNVERVLKPNGLIFITVRKKIAKKDRLKFKLMASRTYAPIEGDEKGVIHYLFNKELLRKEFKNFKIHNLWLDYGKKKWEYYYCLLGELKSRRN